MTSTSQPSDVTLRGQYYSGTDSHPQAATLQLAGGSLFLDTGNGFRPLPRDGLTISPRVGRTPRYLHLLEDGVFETTDNDSVDRLARQLHRGPVARMVHSLENHLGLILLATVVTVVVTVFTFTHGIPWAAKTVSIALPNDIAQQLGDTTLTSLDATWLSPSELPEPRQANLKEAFQPYLAPANGQPMKVLFRSSEFIGANAMALPDGALIFTDDLVKLAQNDDELVAILAHEVGHVAHRHGLQGVVQSSLMFWVFVMMTGDLSSFSDGTVMGPAMLMSLAYSRDMEREADLYALATMRDHGLDPMHFANIMERLVRQHEEDESVPADTADEEHWSDRASEFLSSHPVSEERINMFREASSQP